MATHVLGVSAFYHDAAACLVRDGAIVFAAEEERFSRVKHDHAFPDRAIAAALEHAGIGPGDVDAIVFYEKTLPKIERQLDTWLGAWPRSFTSFVRGMSRYLDGRLDLRRWLQKKGFRREILFSEHHLSHAAFAFFASPFERAAVLVADGVGERATTSVWRAGPNEFVAEREIVFPDSLGLFYSLVTAHLGFRVNEDEYKVMGLSAYGEDAYAGAMKEILSLEDGGAFRLERRFVDFAASERATTAALEGLLGSRRAPGEPIEARHRDIARSAQAHLEAALVRISEAIAPEEPLCFVGGVALNVAANARLARSRPLFVPFAPGDSGGAIGAAFVGASLDAGSSPRSRARVSPFIGPAYSREACVAAARAHGLDAEPLPSLDAVAERLAAGDVVGFFDGAMEFGPRALGARSILADPRAAEMRDHVNARVKHREPFRPFAPAVPEERARELFAIERAVPWMTEIAPVHESKRGAIAAVVHVDGTARVQTVSARDLPRFHALLLAFEKHAGVPVLLNTSFNVAGEPIVCSPEDACRCYAKAELDVLVLGDLWIRRRRS